MLELAVMMATTSISAKPQSSAPSRRHVNPPTSASPPPSAVPFPSRSIPSAVHLRCYGRQQHPPSPPSPEQAPLRSSGGAHRRLARSQPSSLHASPRSYSGAAAAAAAAAFPSFSLEGIGPLSPDSEAYPDLSPSCGTTTRTIKRSVTRTVKERSWRYSVPAVQGGSLDHRLFGGTPVDEGAPRAHTPARKARVSFANAAEAGVRRGMGDAGPSRARGERERTWSARSVGANERGAAMGGRNSERFASEGWLRELNRGLAHHYGSPVWGPAPTHKGKGRAQELQTDAEPRLKMANILGLATLGRGLGLGDWWPADAPDAAPVAGLATEPSSPELASSSPGSSGSSTPSAGSSQERRARHRHQHHHQEQAARAGPLHSALLPRFSSNLTLTVMAYTLVASVAFAVLAGLLVAGYGLTAWDDMRRRVGGVYRKVGSVGEDVKRRIAGARDGVQEVVDAVAAARAGGQTRPRRHGGPTQPETAAGCARWMAYPGRVMPDYRLTENRPAAGASPSAGEGIHGVSAGDGAGSEADNESGSATDDDLSRSSAAADGYVVGSASGNRSSYETTARKPGCDKPQRFARVPNQLPPRPPLATLIASLVLTLCLVLGRSAVVRWGTRRAQTGDGRASDRERHEGGPEPGRGHRQPHGERGPS